MNIQASAPRRGGRAARRTLRTAPRFEMLPTLTRGLPVVGPMSAEQVEKIHEASLAILEEVGVVFRDPIALEDWNRAGAELRGERVHLDRALVMDLIRTIPSEIRYAARIPDKNVQLGAPNSVFVPMTGAPCMRDLDDAEGVRWDDFDEALADVRDLGSGCHYLGHPHTQANFERAFFMPRLFDNNSVEQWIADGSKDITQRALKQARKLLSDYEEPKLDEGIDEGLRDYIARRSREIPAADALNEDA